jgi:hypothetical protein
MIVPLRTVHRQEPFQIETLGASSGASLSREGVQHKGGQDFQDAVDLRAVATVGVYLQYERPQTDCRFWIVVVLTGLLLYPLSFGPACWFGERNGIGTSGIATAYQPIIWLAHTNDGPAARVILWYAGVGASSRAEPYVSRAGEVRWLHYPYPLR